MFRRFLVLFVCGFSLHSLAYEESSHRLPPSNSPKPLPDKNITPTARTCPGLNGAYVTGEFIYWKARQDEFIYASFFDFEIDFTTGNSQFVIKPQELEFKFDPGFKLGVGGDLPFDGWDLYLNWTHFHTVPSSCITSADHNIIAFFEDGVGGSGGPPALGRKACASWNLMFNSLDFDWGRRFYLSKTLTVRPSFGGKAVWIHQKTRFDLEDVEIFFVGTAAFPESFRLTNDFWGIGPYAAFDGKWVFGWGVGLYGAVSSALLWGKFKQENDSVSAQFIGQLQVLSRGFDFETYRVRPTIQAFIGLDWEWCFIENWLSVNCRLGYETQYFWSQVLNAIEGKEESDLSFEGLTFMGRIDF